MNIEKILKGREGKTLEFKRDISSLKPIMKTLVAFANTAGGILIIGREDDGTIRGISDVLQVESYSLPWKNTEINIFPMPVSVVQDSEEQINQIL